MFRVDRNCQQMYDKGQKGFHWQYQQFPPNVSCKGLLKRKTPREVSSASSTIKQWLERDQHWFDYWFNVFRRGSPLATEALRRRQGAMRTGRGTRRVARYWFTLRSTTSMGNRSWQLLESQGQGGFMPWLSLTVLGILTRKCFWFFKKPSKMETLRRWRSANATWCLSVTDAWVHLRLEELLPFFPPATGKPLLCTPQLGNALQV